MATIKVQDDITELETIEPERVDGVKSAANGFPILMLKALPEPEAEAADDGPTAKSLPDWHADATALVKKAMTRGKVNEQPDIDGGVEAIKLLGKLIGYEAQELAAGHLDEIDDVSLLAEAGGLMTAWLSRERSAGMADADAGAMDSALAQSAAAKATAPDAAFTRYLQGVLQEATLRYTDAAKAVMDSVAEEIPAAEPAAVAKDEADGQTEPQGTGDLSKAVEDAVTKATAPLKAEIESLQAFKAKVEALPVPGGPVMSLTRVTAQGAGGEDQAAKAAYYDEMAASVASPSDADNYRQLAAQARAKITS